MRHKTSQQIFAYWNEVRGTRLAPRRFEIEPSSIAPILPETFILEHAEGDGFRFRLAGSRICDQLGREMRGLDLVDFFTMDDAAEISGDLAALSRQGAVLVATFAVSHPDGRRCELEAVLLPLIHSRNVVSRVLGSLVALDPPSWLGGIRVVRLEVVDHQVIWPDGRPHSAVEHANRQAPFLPEIPGTRLVVADRRRFRVYDGGRATTPIWKTPK